MPGASLIDPDLRTPPRNRRERRAMKAARATDMRNVRLTERRA